MNNNSNGYRTSKRIHVVVLKLVTDWEEALREQYSVITPVLHWNKKRWSDEFMNSSMKVLLRHVLWCHISSLELPRCEGRIPGGQLIYLGI